MHFILTNVTGFILLILLALFPETGQNGKKPLNQQKEKEALAGAWELTSGGTQFATLPENATAIALLEDGYFTIAYFSKADKKFIGTYGGTYTISNGKLTQTFEFNTLDSATVGTTATLTYTLKNGQLQLNGPEKAQGLKQIWKKAEEAGIHSPLAGTWRITGRATEDGTMNKMRPGPRKTHKVLSGSRFQWIAFNTETKQFSGTGGGTYTAENGKYTENIEFFSRDSSRVGASLSFNYNVKEDKWQHTGQSSTGKEINEVWERQ